MQVNEVNEENYFTLYSFKREAVILITIFEEM